MALYTGKSIITAELAILRRLAAALREHYELSQDGGTTELHQKQTIFVIIMIDIRRNRINNGPLQ